VRTASSQLAPALELARHQTDALFRLVIPEAMYDRPIPERHRLIFYLGHLEAFDWNQMCRGALGMPSFQPGFDILFEFGIDPPVGTLPQDVPGDWPSVQEVSSYNRRVRQLVDEHLGDVPSEIAHVAIEHREMHAETLAYMLHNLPLDRKVEGAGRGAQSPLAVRAGMVEIPAGVATMGRARGDGFGWDNEFEAQRVDVPAFTMARYKVTNGEYQEYVEQGAPAPYFWVRRPGGWHQRTMFDEVPLPLDWPVYVTHNEAAAYARWKGMRLPSEAQFQRAAYGNRAGDIESDPDTGRGNFDFRKWDPDPVGQDGGNAFGLSQMVGNGWEWTRTEFGPLPGFQPFPFYPGYSANFFDGEHFVLKGASMRTAAGLTRRSFRNWFRRDYPYVYAGFRLLES
jgi:formylglycine-generating enzyme required for sulfatase activity